jgi:hypothetical protein
VVHKHALDGTLAAFADGPVGDGPITFVASDETEDRLGDVLRSEGWDLDGYRRNPVFLWAHDYTQEVIVDTLAPGNPDGDGSVYHFAVWEGRVPYWTKRSVAAVDYYLWLEDEAQARFAQSGHDLRNRVRTKHLVRGVTTRTAVANDTASQAAYPVRELTVGQGEVNATNAANARDQALEEQKLPRQQQSLTVKGRVWSATNGELIEEPKWGVRAGKVVRVQDLVPASASSPAFDNLRTFYILETEYDAVTDTLKVQPDRPAPKVSSLLARRTPVETRR